MEMDLVKNSFTKSLFFAFFRLKKYKNTSILDE